MAASYSIEFKPLVGGKFRSPLRLMSFSVDEDQRYGAVTVVGEKVPFGTAHITREVDEASGFVLWAYSSKRPFDEVIIAVSDAAGKLRARYTLTLAVISQYTRGPNNSMGKEVEAFAVDFQIRRIEWS
jgi:hypothetical protein